MEEKEPKFDFVQRVEQGTRPNDAEMFEMMCERCAVPSPIVVAGIRQASVSAQEAIRACLFLTNAMRKLGER